MSDIYKSLRDKIKDRSLKIGVIGLGYVGLPLAVEFAKNGYHTLGVDLNKAKVKKIIVFLFFEKSFLV